MAGLGINIISSRRDPDWPEQLRRLELAQPDVLKVQMPVGFGTSTKDVAAALDRIPSIKSVILRGQDCEVDYPKTAADLSTRRHDFDGPLGSWLNLIRQRPQITFWIEVGNEPEHCGLDIRAYRDQSLATVRQLRSDLRNFNNVRFTISMPVELRNVVHMFNDTEYEDICDGIATHLYAVHDLDHPVSNWREIYDWLLAHTSLPILITEAGVNDVTQTATQRAAHYVDYLSRQPERMHSVTLFGSVSEDLKWQAWKLDDAGLRTLAGRLKDPDTGEPDPPVVGTPIFGPSLSTPALVRQWAIEVRKAHQRFLDVIPIYFELAPLYGIPAERALAQAAKETDDGHYTGVVPAWFHNWCGLKTETATGDLPEDHQQFATDREGVEAHLQHLARYGGATAIPAGREMHDPRWRFVTQFTDTFEGLGGEGSWAPSPTYGIEIVVIIRTIPTEGTPSMSLTDTIRDRLNAAGLEVHDLRGELERHTTLTYKRLPPTAWIYTAVHTSGSPRARGVRDLLGDMASWKSHAFYHVNTQGWPGIAYFIGVSQSSRVFILRDVDEEGYHAFNANKNTLGLCGDLGVGEAPTPGMLDSFVKVIDTLQDDTPDLPNLKGHDGTYGHDELDFLDTRNDTTCPDRLLGFVQAYRRGEYERPEEPLVINFEDNPYGASITIVRGFAGFAQRLGTAVAPHDPRHGILAVIGYPKDYERPTDFGAEQRCQKATLHWLRDAAGTEWEFQLAHVETDSDGSTGVDPEIVKSAIDALAAVQGSLQGGLPS